jgi:hypothetical protein
MLSAEWEMPAWGWGHIVAGIAAVILWIEQRAMPEIVADHFESFAERCQALHDHLRSDRGARE